MRFIVKETNGVYAVVDTITGKEEDWADTQDEAEAVATECEAWAKRQAAKA